MKHLFVNHGTLNDTYIISRFIGLSAEETLEEETNVKIGPECIPCAVGESQCYNKVIMD
jgi:hypothetical protein